MYINRVIKGAKGQLWVRAGCPMHSELHLGQTNTITSRLSQAENEALCTTSLSSQLTAAGTNGIVLTPPPRPSARDCFCIDSRTKADQSAKHSSPETKTTHMNVTEQTTRWGGCHSLTVELEPKQHEDSHCNLNIYT